MVVRLSLAPSRRYVVTTRSIPLAEGHVQREISIDTSLEEMWAFNTSRPPRLSLNGTWTHQAYAQVTWRWHNVYLGLVAVYDTPPASAAEKVACSASIAPGGGCGGHGRGRVLGIPDCHRDCH